ncbi:MAG: NAD(P)/FAD-dependent oxidoreductase [Spirochaetae bacterium HGW-Spirochaetae-1]|jgi:nitrite reductase (NADH) large subunit|nr:MAG: NAD(P)/FAD-dependent oxidoreductase [Spirochaetae bacterium HGW-Spirochaetae-1]
MKYVIIGNGTAGVDAALTIRKNDPLGEISIITEAENLHYYRPRLVEYLANEVPLEKFTLYKPEFYAEKNISNILNTRITAIDPAEKTVTDEKGVVYHYDRLLLATGGNPFVPPVQGIDHEGVFTLRNVADTDRIRDFSTEIESIAVIGGGLLGLETANSLQKLGKKVTIIEFAPWLLPRQLDRTGGELLQKMLEDKGLQFILNDSVASIDSIGGRFVEQISLKSGKTLKADAVVLSVGIRCNCELARTTGLSVNNGIVVNDHMETSQKDIYAAGDAAEHNNVVYGLWNVSKEQGIAAGLNMSGVQAEYKGSAISTILKITGIDLFSAGVISDEGNTVNTSVDTSSYKKLLMKEDSPVGAIVLGDRESIKIAQKVMNRNASVEEFLKHLKN